MKDSQRKAMFAKGKIPYLSWYEVKPLMHKIAKRHDIKTIRDWDAFKITNKLPSNIPRHPEIVYSKKNIQRNIDHGVDVKKEVFY